MSLTKDSITQLDGCALALLRRYGITAQSAFEARLVSHALVDTELSLLSPEQLNRHGQISDPNRLKEWSESRRCEWALQDYSLRSLSHSKSDQTHIVFGWGLKNLSQPIRGIGIDTELKTRVISDSVAERYSTADERKLPLTPLQIWNAKEALFKANPHNDGTVVLNYQILKFDPEVSIGEAADPEGERCAFLVTEIGDWSLSLALAL